MRLIRIASQCTNANSAKPAELSVRSDGQEVACVVAQRIHGAADETTCGLGGDAEFLADLAADERLAGSQVHRFLVLHKELDADDGELTRTRKVRRGFIAERYANLVEALYSHQDRVKVESEVRYEDGRVGTLSAELSLRDAVTYPQQTLRKAA